MTLLDVGTDDHIRGPVTARATLLVYGDYECPYTRALELAVAQVRRRDNDLFRYVYRYFPLREIHPHAELAAEAAEAVYALAGPAGFWRMHDELFANQMDLEIDNLERLAVAVGVEPMVFRAALETHRFAARIERDVQSGAAHGVEGTPSIFINGARYQGHRDTASLRAAIGEPHAQGR